LEMRLFFTFLILVFHFKNVAVHFINGHFFKSLFLFGSVLCSAHSAAADYYISFPAILSINIPIICSVPSITLEYS
jgi:hypothetical protein